ncbi:hypothetical protein BB561_006749 [Smittium simulii]|uniref:Uncharacterized protein n=1 Tax=Smittium simulii TaxID=133385 RepID=A0A2T9Y1R9_9FUNG|nr:hypothetical protein BB561_006749 [Smittium simulii]
MAIKRFQQGQHDQPIITDAVDVELPHVVARAPVTDLIYYSELLEVITLVEKFFFRNPLPEEEWKDIIYFSPKGNVMHCTPPTLNDTASVMVKKNPESNHKENPDITITLEVRLLLADAASNITQLRRELIYKTIDLPERAPKLAEETNDSLFEPKQFDTIVESKKKKQRNPRPRSRRPFLQRQQAARTSLYILAVWIKLTNNLWIKNIVERDFKVLFKFTYALKFKAQQEIIEFSPSLSFSPQYLLLSVQEKVNQRSKHIKIRNFFGPFIKECYRANKDWLSGFLQQPVYNSKEDRRPKTDGIPDICMQDDEEERLHDIFRSRGCVSTNPYTPKLQETPKVYVEQDEPSVQSSPIWVIIEPTHIHQYFEALIDMGKKTMDQNIVILGQSTNCSRYQEEMFKTYSSSIQQVDRAWIQDQQQEFIDDPHTINPTLRNNH